MTDDDSIDATEASVLSGFLIEPRVRAKLTELEPADFSDLRLRRAFEAARNLEAEGKQVGVVQAVEYLQALDRERDTHVAEKVDVVFLAGLAAATAPYEDALYDASVHARRLRERRQARERGEAVLVVTGDREASVRAARGENQFLSMPVRIGGEREERKRLGIHALAYNQAYLDDRLRAIAPHDLVLLGAPSGVGKTDLALAIAMENAMAGRAVAYFALEAEPLELERRTKFAFLSAEMHHRRTPGREELNFADWMLGRCEDVVPLELDEAADRHFVRELCGMHTYYRGQRFGADDLRKQILAVHKHVDLIVVDHLHYVDQDDDQSENRALTETMKAIRDVSLRIGKPILVVAHLRKRDQRSRQLLPGLDDFHGSSNLTKIATQVITLERAYSVDAPKWWLSPTFVSVPKDRRTGADGLVALVMFDRRTRRYEQHYTLGRLIKGGSEWEPLKPGDQPSWARGHRQLELEL